MRSSQIYSCFCCETIFPGFFPLQLRFSKHNQLWKTLGFGLDGSVVLYTTVTGAPQVRFLESQNNFSYCCQWLIKRRTAKLQWEWGARSARMCVVISLKGRVRAARPNPLFIINGSCLLLYCYTYSISRPFSLNRER
jgi:hypothetical protein